MPRLAQLTLIFALLAGPPLSSAANWTDVTGEFSINAELVELADEAVVLRKNDGQEIRVPLVRLDSASRKQAIELAKQTAPAAVSFGPPQKYRVRIGLEMTAASDVTGLQGIITVPMDWPEQQVKIVDEETTREVRRISYRTLEDGAKQMLILVPRLAAGESATATVTFELLRSPIDGPKATEALKIPTRVSRDVRHYLAPGPLTPSEAKSIVAAKNAAIEGIETDWEQVRAIHDYAVDNVRYVERAEIKDAETALAEGVGDCQELSSLFVAMCRAHGVPARCVWIPGHSYAEFYLEDAAGGGHWYPTESTNKQQFGFLPRTDIILQKGDNFRMPELPGRLHYAQTVLYGKTRNAGEQPTFKEIFEIERIPK